MGLTFFTVADPRYEPFVLPYLASSLHHNPEADAEIRLTCPNRFRSNNREALGILNTYFRDRFKLSRYTPQDGVPPNSVRFFETPLSRADYVYIGDIDILILEEVAPGHVAHMEATGLPYSNIRRPNKPALSGLHFTKWDAYYPPPEITDAELLCKDEFALCAIVESKGFGLPDCSDTFRPVHGYHLSITRDTAGSHMSWGGIRSPDYLQPYIEFARSNLWQQITPLFDARYRHLLSMLDFALAVRFRDETCGRVAAPGTLPRDWW